MLSGAQVQDEFFEDECKRNRAGRARRVKVSVEHGVVTLASANSRDAGRETAETGAAHAPNLQPMPFRHEVGTCSYVQQRDSQIAQAVSEALKWRLWAPSSVKVVVSHGWVTLTGRVIWRIERSGAEKEVRRLSGVKGITNLIDIKPMVDLADVKQRIKAAFAREAEIQAQKISVEVLGGKVILSGCARSLGERRTAESAAWSTPGVSEVDTDVALEPPCVE